MSERLRSIIGLLALLAAALGAGALTLPARAAEPLCFSQPGVADCVAGVFRDYWEGAGGLPTFGYPISPAKDESTPAGTFLTQYFERARFEYHPENPQPFQVQLGLLGRELYGPSVIPPDRQQSGCQYFAATGYNVCPPFLNRWQAAGETLGRGSLDLYGLPISPLLVAQDREGRPISVQWFERARFELHSQNQILLGLLGRELLERAAQPTPAPPPAYPSPGPAPAPVAPPPAYPAPEPIAPEPTPAPTAPPPPTPIPAPIEAPFPLEPCDENVPAPIEGIQAWAVMPVVGPPFDAIICVRLIVGGEPAHPAFVQTFRGTPDGVIASEIHTTSFEGVADFIFYVGTIPSGATIPVEAVATFAGREYRTTIAIRRD